MQGAELDIDPLAEILDGDEAMSPEAVLGAFVALYSVPEVVPPSVWLPVVLGDKDLGDNPGPAITALMDLYNSIGDRLESKGMFCPPPDEHDSIRDFCAGYIEILGLEQEWVEQEAELAFILMSLVDPSVLDDPEVSIDIDPDQWLDYAREDLLAVLEEIYLRNRGQAPGQVRPAQSTKVNRNAPCPCGSGRKFKKCCGAS